MTKYLVLRKNQKDWIEVGITDAASARVAISSVVKGLESKNGEWVAVPARSWQPVKVQVETALKFS